jgi:ABC-type xylose transport system permease subunit
VAVLARVDGVGTAVDVRHDGVATGVAEVLLVAHCVCLEVCYEIHGYKCFAWVVCGMCVLYESMIYGSSGSRIGRVIYVSCQGGHVSRIK